MISYCIQHKHEQLDQSSSVAKHVEGQEGNVLPGHLISSVSPVPIPKVCSTSTKRGVSHILILFQIIQTVQLNSTVTDNENNEFKVKIFRIIGKKSNNFKL